MAVGEHLWNSILGEVTLVSVL